jgi:hypothetical protein
MVTAMVTAMVTKKIRNNQLISLNDNLNKCFKKINKLFTYFFVYNM